MCQLVYTAEADAAWYLPRQEDGPRKERDNGELSSELQKPDSPSGERQHQAQTMPCAKQVRATLSVEPQKNDAVQVRQQL
jgi:hypothetical protein